MKLNERYNSVLNNIIPYVGKPNVYVSFRDIVKFGINPSPLDPTTPVGIYGYPLTKSFYNSMEDRTIPSYGYRPYLYLFKTTGNIIDLSQYTQQDLDNDLARMIDMFIKFLGDARGERPNNEYAADMILQYLTSVRLGQNTPADQFWAATRGFSRRLGIQMNRKHSSVWNGLIRQLGYDGLLDPGMSVIHTKEPSQILVMSKASCDVIDMMINDL